MISKYRPSYRIDSGCYVDAVQAIDQSRGLSDSRFAKQMAVVP